MKCVTKRDLYTVRKLNLLKTLAELTSSAPTTFLDGSEFTWLKQWYLSRTDYTEDL